MPFNAGCYVASLTKERVDTILSLDPETGWLTHKVYRSSNAQIGSRAGYVSTKDGYRRISIDDVMYLEHKVIWLMVYGEMPDHEVDHENRVRDDNRPDNLRPATGSQNRANAKIRSDNTSGHRGATFHSQTGKFAAAVQVNGRKKSFGLHATVEEAGEAARRARLAIFGEHAPSYDHQGAA